MKFFHRRIKQIFDDIFKNNVTCNACGSELKYEGVEDSLCEECRTRLRLCQSENVCKKCGKPIKTEGVCPVCASGNHYFCRAVSPFEYRDVVAEWIMRMKFFGARYFYETFGNYMVKKVADEGFVFDVIVAVPMSRSDEIKRGYNQANDLASYIAEKVAKPNASKCIEKIKKTLPQHNLDAEQRRHNLKGAFRVNDASLIVGRRVLVVDDLFTTGSTVEEVSKTLLDAGADEIFVVTIANKSFCVEMG